MIVEKRKVLQCINVRKIRPAHMYCVHIFLSYIHIIYIYVYIHVYVVCFVGEGFCDCFFSENRLRRRLAKVMD